MPSPQPSLGPVKRVRVRRNSRRVAPGSTSPSRSSTRSPFTAKTTAAADAEEDGAGAVEGEGAAIAARSGALRGRVRVGTRFSSGRRPQLAYLSTVLYSTTVRGSRLHRHSRSFASSCRVAVGKFQAGTKTGDADGEGGVPRVERHEGDG